MENVRIEKTGDNQRVCVAARSALGGRREQQDRAYAHISADEALVVVCDGMGGTADGGRASELAVEAVRQVYADAAPLRGERVPDFLRQAMDAADQSVTKELARGSGTTMVAALVRENTLFWLSVGDSRLYILRSGELIQATRDHNYYLRLREMLETGAIQQDRYAAEEERGEALISYIGMGGIDLYDLTQSGFALRPKDVLLLTTDGLYKAVGQEEMRGILDSEETSLAARADRLLAAVTRAVDTELQDNTTFVLMSVL